MNEKRFSFVSMSGFRALMCAVFVAVGLAACTRHDDNPVVNPQLVEQIQGNWIAINDFWDEDDDAYFESEDFEDIDPSLFDAHREVVYVDFDEAGNGSFLFFAVDQNNEPVGGEGDGLQLAMSFNYAIQPDGSIKVISKAPTEDMEDNEEFRFRYENGSLIADDGEQQFTLHRPTAAEAAQMTTWMIALGMGGASADNYNINDEDFTPENWREQEAIYIYDGQGKDVTDAKGRTGYTLVNMPWYQGIKLTNLPDGFCDDLLPENGWEWVLNCCGSRNIVNNNFFAVYNKYTGILRFFYYLPYGFSTGNDHVWQVSMTDHMAQSSSWGYGVPQDKTITDKTQIGQKGSGTYMEYITPWVDYRSQDGLIVPNAGWWAFDVDLSQRRADGFTATDNIKLQMRSWTTQHVSLTSAITAKIDGSMLANFDITKTNVTVSSAKGLTESFGDIKDLGQTLYGAIKTAMTGDYIGAIKTGISFAKGAYNIYGAMTKETSTTITVDTIGKGSLTGTLDLALNGSIDTEGTIRGSTPTVGIASPTFYMKDFDTRNSHLGQGTWNLKTSPVVYITDVRLKCNTDYYTPWDRIVGPRYGCVYFFDPSSVEVELNPNIFPEDQIEWMQVDAIPGARFANKITGPDNFRNAIGLKSRDTGVTSFCPLKNTPYAEQVLWLWKARSGSLNLLADFLYNQEETYGLDYTNGLGPVEKVGNLWMATYGRAEKGAYVLNPQMALGTEDHNVDYDSEHCCVAPGIEINVSVKVKLKGKKDPIVYNRVFLPEIEFFASSTLALNQFYETIKNRPVSQLQNGHRELYDYEVKRIKDMVDLLKPYIVN